jgi:glycosyltransferase involved in cell wall biosynthesis
VGGIREIIESGRQGFLIEDRTPRNFADKINLLSANNALYASMRRASIKKIQENFSAEGMARKYFEIYESLVQ